MGKIFEAIGLLTVVASVLYVGVAKSAFQETTAAILWCGGWLIYAAGVGLRRLNKTFSVVPGECSK